MCLTSFPYVLAITAGLEAQVLLLFKLRTISPRGISLHPGASGKSGRPRTPWAAPVPRGHGQCLLKLPYWWPKVGGALLALTFRETYKHTYGAHKAHKYRVGVLNLLCADTGKVFVVPMEVEQLLGSPSASFSGLWEGHWKTCYQTQTKVRVYSGFAEKGVFCQHRAKCVGAKPHQGQLKAISWCWSAPALDLTRRKCWLLISIWNRVCEGRREVLIL